MSLLKSTTFHPIYNDKYIGILTTKYVKQQQSRLKLLAFIDDINLIEYMKSDKNRALKPPLTIQRNTKILKKYRSKMTTRKVSKRATKTFIPLDEDPSLKKSHT